MVAKSGRRWRSVRRRDDGHRPPPPPPPLRLGRARAGGGIASWGEEEEEAIDCCRVIRAPAGREGSLRRPRPYTHCDGDQHGATAVQPAQQSSRRRLALVWPPPTRRGHRAALYPVRHTHTHVAAKEFKQGRQKK